MSHEQDRMCNPFGMDETCTNCPALSDSRQQIVHGYGDVTAEFLFVAESPDAKADELGHPLGDRAAFGLRSLLDTLGFLDPGEDPPRVHNAFITHLTRCRHPDRPPSDTEIATCEPFLNAELRSINPEIIVPMGTRVLRTLAAEHTTQDPTSLDVSELHAEPVRGRGFELLPSVAFADMNPDRFDAFVAAMRATMDRDYRQTKGRQGR